MDLSRGASERTLATNAPPHWPLVPALASSEALSAKDLVEALTDAVAVRLARAGLDVVASGRQVTLGAETVRIDLVARDATGEVPILVFPGLDPEREGAMFSFLSAALRESQAFNGTAVYYAAAALPFTTRPDGAAITERAEMFLARSARSNVDLSWSAGASGVVAAVRALAGAPVESGGGEAVIEAASFVGEWLRRRVTAEWALREGLPQSALLVADTGRGEQWQLPLFAWFPDAVRTGYDGLEILLERIVAPDTDPATEQALPVSTPAYRRHAAEWLDETLAEASEYDERVLLLRRCAACGEMTSGHVVFDSPTDGFDAALERTALASRAPPATCAACGGRDYRESVVLHLFRIAAGRVLIVSEFSDSHVRVAAREVIASFA